MRSWKQLAGLTAMFVAVALVASAGRAPREDAEARAQRAKIQKAATTMAAKLAAKEAGLAKDKTEKFVAAYVESAQAMRKKLAEMRESGDMQNMREVFTESRKKTQAMLETHLGADGAKKVRGLLSGFGGLESSISALLRAKVAEAKIEKASSVLIKYHKEAGTMFRRGAGGGDAGSREERMAKRTKMRETTAKALAPIVGEEAAAAWQKGGMGRRGGGARRGGGGGGGAGGAGGGNR